MTRKVLRNFFLLLAAFAALLLPAVAQGRGQGDAHKQKDKNQMEQDNGKHQGGVQMTMPVFGPRECDLIGGYYQNQYSNLPPGLAKRGGNLPPGLQKQLQRNGTLPPGLQKRLQPFPSALSRQLPRLPANYTYGVIDGSAVIINQRTRTVVDVMYNLLNRAGM